MRFFTSVARGIHIDVYIYVPICVICEPRVYLLAIKYIQWTRLCACVYIIYLYIYETLARAKLEILEILPCDYHHHPTCPPTRLYVYIYV